MFLNLMGKGTLAQKAMQKFRSDGLLSLLHVVKKFSSDRLLGIYYRAIQHAASPRPSAPVEDAAYPRGSVSNKEEVYYVNPCWINYALSQDELTRQLAREGKLHLEDEPVVPCCAGEWDRNRGRIRKDVRFKAIRKYHDEKARVADTEYGRFLRYRNSKPVGDLIERFENLYENIKHRGYDPACPISVAVGRDGEYLVRDGRHRIAIVKVLELDLVPVRVCVRHRKWQDVREEIKAAETVEKLSSKARRNLVHPDVRDVVPKTLIEEQLV